MAACGCVANAKTRRTETLNGERWADWHGSSVSSTQHNTQDKSQDMTRQDTLHHRQRLCVMVRCVLAWSKLHSLLAAARCIVAPCDPYREHGTERPRQGGLCTKCAGTWVDRRQKPASHPTSQPTINAVMVTNNFSLESSLNHGSVISQSSRTVQSKRRSSWSLIQGRGPSDRPHDIYFALPHLASCLAPTYKPQG